MWQGLIFFAVFHWCPAWSCSFLPLGRFSATFGQDMKRMTLSQMELVPRYRWFVLGLGKNDMFKFKWYHGCNQNVLNLNLKKPEVLRQNLMDVYQRCFGTVFFFADLCPETERWKSLGRLKRGLLPAICGMIIERPFRNLGFYGCTQIFLKRILPRFIAKKHAAEIKVKSAAQKRLDAGRDALWRPRKGFLTWNRRSLQAKTKS